MDATITGNNNNIIKLVKKNNAHKSGRLNLINVQNRCMAPNEIYLKNNKKFEPKYSLYFYKEKIKDYEEEEEEEKINIKIIYY